jgi:hypothetical protein
MDDEETERGFKRKSFTGGTLNVTIPWGTNLPAL